jgi:predicted MFS family arabinose efflux permease
MRTGLVCLVLAYVLSQFYRAFLAVLAPTLEAELGATADTLATASGLWFLTFALMQLPIGWALDRIGPRWTAALPLALGGAGGCVVFALADAPGDVHLAMALIGVGCAPVLMAAYVLIGRSLPPSGFAAAAAAIIGIGTLGNVLSATPLATAIEGLGWRQTLCALAALTLAIAGAIALFVRDPARLPAAGRDSSLFTLLRMRTLWPVLVMMAVCYMPVAALRGFWLGPYHAQVFGLSTAEIGQVALWMGLAMVAGSFIVGPLERAVGTRKGVVLAMNGLLALLVLCLWGFGTESRPVTLALFVGIGLLGTTFPLVVAHGRAFVPPELLGRGVTLLNMFGIASVGIAQVATGWLFRAAPASAPGAGFQAVYLAIAAVTLAGCAVYAFSRDRRD